MKITLTISDKQLADILDGAASRYWCNGLEFDPFRRGLYSCWHALLDGALKWVTVLEDTDANGRGGKRHRVTRTKLMIALDIMAREYPQTLGEVFGSDGQDANTGDVLLQLAALGEVRYG